MSACQRKDEERLRKMGEGKTKCDRMCSEDYGKKLYISQKIPHVVRQIFRTRFGLQPFAGNYSNDRRFLKSNWLCRCQKVREEESHLLDGSCQVYGDLRIKYNSLTNDDDLTKFFKEVLERREELEDEEKYPNSRKQPFVARNATDVS